MKKIIENEFIAAIVAVVIVLTYFIVGVLTFAGRQYNDIHTKNLEEAVRIYKSLTPAEVFTDNDAVREWISGFKDSDLSTLYRITLINRGGQVVYDSDADSFAMESHFDRPEFQNAVTKGMGTNIRESETLGHIYIYAAITILDANDQFAGILRLSRMVPGFYIRIFSTALPLLITGLIIIIGVFAGLFVYTHRASRSIQSKLNAKLEEKTKELKITTQEAETENRRREVILNSMFEGVIALNSSLRIILVNPRLCSLFGIQKGKDVRDMSLLEFSNSSELEDVAKAVIATGRPCELNLKRYVSGSEQHFQVNAAPLQTPETSTHGVVMVLRDISLLVRLEQVRKDFAANVSHELRTPIQIIQGFAETIMDSPPENAETLRHFASIIKKNAKSMDNLTRDLLTLVSLEDEGTRPSLEEIALEPLLKEAAEAVQLNAQVKNIAIEISCPPELKAHIHNSLFSQAVVNLLDNAIKYSGNDSNVTVYVYLDEESINIEVKDKGIGIPAEHIDRIFERFYRVDRSRSREAGGTGLGLSIVRHIARLHRGTVEAESHAGEGSLFRICLPHIKST